MSIKGSRIAPNKDPEVIETVPTLELLFIRLRMAPVVPGQSPADGLRLYAFGTTENLTRLVSFAPYAIPKDANDCTIRSTVRITEYGLAGQLPSARAARTGPGVARTRNLRFRTSTSTCAVVACPARLWTISPKY